MMDRHRAVLMLALFWIPAAAQVRAQTPRARKVDGGAASFSIVDRADGTHWWRRSNKDFRIETVQLNARGDLLHYLFLTEQVVDTHIGIEGTKSRLKVTAYPLAETHVAQSVWSFEVDGDVWKLLGDRIQVTKYGCCGEPDRTSYFRVSDGRPTE
jgi:hypothetical protein